MNRLSEFSGPASDLMGTAWDAKLYKAFNFCGEFESAQIDKSLLIRFRKLMLVESTTMEEEFEWTYPARIIENWVTGIDWRDL